MHSTKKTLPLLLCLSGAALSQEAAQDTTAAQLPTVVVTGEREGESYVPPVNDSAALKVDAPILKTPQSVSVVTNKVIEDQGAMDVEDIVRNSSGTATGGYYRGWNYIRVRGFDVGNSIYTDGLRSSNFLDRSSEVFGLEEAQVLKGPSSTLYGQGGPGGIVNLVSKRPQEGFFGELGTQVDSFESLRFRGDINTPLYSSEDGSFHALSRLIGVYQEGKTPIDFNYMNRRYVAPSFTLQWNDTTRLTLLGSWQKDNDQHSMPLPARGTVLPNANGKIPLDRFVGIPDKGGKLGWERYSLGYDFSHKFSDAIEFRQNFGFKRTDMTYEKMVYPGMLLPDDRTLMMYPYDYSDKADVLQVDSAVDFKFDTGPLRHTLTTGVDVLEIKSKTWSRQIDYTDIAGSYLAFDLFNPNYGASIPNTSFSSESRSKDFAIGYYVQDLIEISDTVTVLLGGRYDDVKQDNGTATYKSHSFTPRAGITWEFAPGVAAFANYSRSFRPQWSSTTSTGAPVEPEEGENWEGGIKYALLDGRITGTVSGFHLTRQNVASLDYSTANPFDYNVSGEQVSKGFEFQMAAELADGLTWTAAYTYVDAEVTEDSVLADGTALALVPRHVANTWLKYSVQDGPLQGFGVGLGARYVSSQSGDTGHTFNLPPYAVVDAALFYEREDFAFQVNFNNILDREYYSGSYSDLYVLPGEPFSVMASATWKF